MYKAIQEIGGYEVGDEVPTEKALVWLEMYSVPQVEEVDGESKKPVEKKAEEKKLETSEKSSSGNAMLDDYLSRNTNVVKKNVEEDDLSQKQLEELLELENSDKKRSVVIQAIEKRLNKSGD